MARRDAASPALPGLENRAQRRPWARTYVDRALRARIAAGSLDADLDADLIAAMRSLADVIDDERAAHALEPDRSRFVQTTATRGLAAVAAQLRAGAPPAPPDDDLDASLDAATLDAAQP